MIVTKSEFKMMSESQQGVKVKKSMPRKGDDELKTMSLKYETIKYSDAKKKLEKSKTGKNDPAIVIQYGQRKRTEGKNYLLSTINTVSEGHTNPAALVGLYGAQSHKKGVSDKVYQLAVKEARNINRALKKRNQIKGLKQKLARSLVSQTKPKTCRKHGTTVFYGFNKEKCFCVCKSPPLDKIGQKENIKVDLKAGEVFMSENDTFRMIALSVMNEAKNDNIRIFCKNCHDRSKSCNGCTFENTALSLAEKESLRAIEQNMWEEQSPVSDAKIVVCRYLLKENAEKLYDSKFSNYKVALSSSMRLKTKLSKNNLLEKFHTIFEDELKKDYYELIEPEDLDPKLPVYFSSINYVLVVTNVKSKLRPINNCSFPHRNGSLNENSIVPPNIENDPVKMLIAFRTNQWIGVLDLANAFKSIYSASDSNNIRNFVWIRSLEKPQMVIWRPKRVNFGSSLSTTFLHVARLKFVSKMTQTPEGLYSCLELTYIDDQTFSGKSPEHLLQVQKDICQAYAKYSFEVKHCITSMDEDKRTQFLAIDWNLSKKDDHGRKSDTIKPNIWLCLQPKKRGKNGEELNEKNLEDLILSKTVAARLLGLLFSYLQADITPILASAKIYFTKVAAVAKDWKSPIKLYDEGLHEEFRKFCISLIGLNDRLKPTNRVIIDDDSVVEKIICCNDAGTYLQCASVYIVTRNVVTNEYRSNIILSKNKIGKLSIPKMELLSSKVALGQIVKFMRSCQRVKEFKFPVYILGDSQANSYNYDTGKSHKCIVTRNCTTIVLQGLKDLVTEYDSITKICMGFVPTEQNAADLCSKEFEDPVEVCNSKFFREGDKQFIDPDFPPAKHIFLTVTKAETVYRPLPLVGLKERPQQVDELENYNISDRQASRWPSHFSDVECCSHCNEEQGKSNNHVFFVSDNSDGRQPVVDLDQICELEQSTYHQLLESVSSFDKLLRVLARCRALFRNQKEKRFPKGKFDIQDMLHAFMTVVKSSQTIYSQEQDIKRHHLYKQGQILFVRSRIGTQWSFTNRSVPYVPVTDKKLVGLLIKKAHTVVIRDPLGVSHTGNALTKARLQSGDWATFVPGITVRIRKYINNCVTCRRYKIRFATTVESRNRFFSFFEKPGIFTYISVDISAPIMLRGSKTDKRPRKFFALITICLISKALHMALLEDYSAAAALTALGHLQLKYSGFISVILTDAGSQLTALDPTDPAFVRPPQIISLPPSNQVLNPIESSMAKIKSLIGTMFLNKEKMSLPTLTVIQAQHVLDYTAAIYNLRQIPGTRQNKDDCMISPFMLTRTYLEKEECERVVKELLTQQEENNENLLTCLVENQQFKKTLMAELKTLLVCNNRAVFQKTPKIDIEEGDICLVRRGTQNLRLVEVTERNPAGNYCSIRVLSRNKIEPKETHVSMLVLVHRPTKTLHKQNPAESKQKSSLG